MAARTVVSPIALYRDTKRLTTLGLHQWWSGSSAILSVPKVAAAKIAAFQIQVSNDGSLFTFNRSGNLSFSADNSGEI